MTEDRRRCDEKVELRPIIGLTKGLSEAEIKALTVDAILKHRQLSAHAELLFSDLPEDIRAGRVVGGTTHLEYIKAMIGLHAHMSILSSLLALLGYIPQVPDEECTVS